LPPIHDTPQRQTIKKKKKRKPGGLRTRGEEHPRRPPDINNSQQKGTVNRIKITEWGKNPWKISASGKSKKLKSRVGVEGLNHLQTLPQVTT